MKRKYLVWLHLAVWLLILANYTWNSAAYRFYAHDRHVPLTIGLFAEYLFVALLYLIISVICFYSAYLLVAPALLRKNKWYLAVVYAALTFMAACGWRYVTEYRIMLPYLGFDNYRGHPWAVSDYISNVFFFYFPSYFVYGLMYFFVESWYKTRLNQQELLKEKAAAELAFLRSQVNPHFLFNSINDIYSLTWQKSDQAPAALLKLSEILRYMLREDPDGLTPLSKEVNYIENVIDLQRISAKGGAFINFSAKGLIDGQKVPSLIFIPFVENAFKHGVLNDADHPVRISLSATPDGIHFCAFNQKNNHQKDITGGIGLNNIKRRLELLYPERHQLIIDDKDDCYNVNLRLPA